MNKDLWEMAENGFGIAISAVCVVIVSLLSVTSVLACIYLMKRLWAALV